MCYRFENYKNKHIFTNHNIDFEMFQIFNKDGVILIKKMYYCTISRNEKLNLRHIPQPFYFPAIMFRL